MHKKTVRWNTIQIIALGFLGVILTGAVLLWLPVNNRQPMSFADALFLSTSAVCVTGLSTVTPAIQFTISGKIILLLLIQIGGLGIIGCTTAFFLMLHRQISVKERLVLQDAYGADHLGGIVVLVKRILLGTFAAEGFGAALYALSFVPQFGLLRGIWYAFFHAVSAFCNAGIDILGDSSLRAYAANPIVNLTTMLLIVISGIGFIVWFDLLETGRKLRRHQLPLRWCFKHLRLGSKLAILMTLILIISGTLIVFLIEYNNPKTLGQFSPGQKFTAALFQSVTTRTAGFYTIPQESMQEESKLICCILMFIGGSPGGTAGGIKTTTFAMLMLSCLTFIRGGTSIECLGRRISVINFRSGFCVFSVALIALITGTVLIAMIEPDNIALVDLLFETSSAIGTVGLSADLTAQLLRPSQTVLMVLMYAGRLGPLTLAALFIGKSNPRDKIRILPEETIMIG